MHCSACFKQMAFIIYLLFSWKGQLFFFLKFKQNFGKTHKDCECYTYWFFVWLFVCFGFALDFLFFSMLNNVFISSTWNKFQSALLFLKRMGPKTLEKQLNRCGQASTYICSPVLLQWVVFRMFFAGLSLTCTASC